jgi:hypothetical protein
MSNTSYVISDGNLSYAWARILWRIISTPGNSEISPLVLTIHGFGPNGEPVENNKIREGLDSFLAENNKWSVEIAAFTIFPQRYLLIANGNRDEFYQICFDALPHLKARNARLNGRGMYFERLMKFGKGKINDNQLEFILAEYLAGRRRASKFHAVIFDPERDQSRQPYQTFPCLQTVTFVVANDGLVLNAVYAMQYLVQRGYGNFLGLANLGAFMAREMKLPFARLNIFAGVEKLDFPKGVLAPFADLIRQTVPDFDSTTAAAA